MIAGGGAYYFAKKSINEDRQTRYREAEEKRRRLALLEHPGYGQPSSGAQQNGAAPRSDLSGSPSQEANIDPAATRHAPDSEAQRLREKSKYEASVPYSATKGDRFS